MRRNLTLAIEEDILDRARVVAAERKRTLTGMVREFLQRLVKESRERTASLRRLRHLMKEKPLGVGERRWRRDDLYER